MLQLGLPFLCVSTCANAARSGDAAPWRAASAQSFIQPGRTVPHLSGDIQAAACRLQFEGNPASPWTRCKNGGRTYYYREDPTELLLEEPEEGVTDEIEKGDEDFEGDYAPLLKTKEMVEAGLLLKPAHPGLATKRQPLLVVSGDESAGSRRQPVRSREFRAICGRLGVPAVIQVVRSRAAQASLPQVRGVHLRQLL